MSNTHIQALKIQKIFRGHAPDPPSLACINLLLGLLQVFEFITFAIECVAFVVEFITFAIEFVALAIEFNALVVELGAIALEIVAFAGNFVTTNQQAPG